MSAAQATTINLLRPEIAFPMPTLNADTAALTTQTLRPGPAAWITIKSNAKKNRENWRVVGLDLLEGRKAHPANIAFGKWCRDEGYGDMRRFDRTAAMWLADNWDSVVYAVHNGVCHPHHIRQAYNALTNGTAPEEDDYSDEPQADQTPAIAIAPAAPPWDDVKSTPPTAPTNTANPPQSPFNPHPTPVNPAPSSVTAEYSVDILNRPKTSAEKLSERAGQLLAMPIDSARAGSAAFGMLLDTLHSDMMLKVAVDSMLDSIFDNNDPETAVDRGIDAIRTKEAEMIEQFTNLVHTLGEKGGAAFLRHARSNPILNKPDRKLSGLISHAFSNTNAESEREAAITALEKIARA